MNMKKLWILLACVVLAVALAVAVALLVDRGSKSVDSDGDGRPDSVDEEPDDNLDGDNESKVDDFFK